MELVTFILIVYGITNIIVYEKVFKRQVDWLRNKNRFLNGVLSCPTCLSFYISVGLFLVAPITFSGVFLMDVLFSGLLSSGAINLLELIKIKFM